MTNEEEGTDGAFEQLYEQYFGTNADEAREIELLPSVLSGVTCFVDVGSSLGQYARAAGEFLNEADIFCVEPDPYKAEYLRELTAQWARHSNNRFHVLELALDERVGNSPFYVPDNHLSSGALFNLRKGHERKLTIVNVKTSTLDKEFGVGGADFIKIDVEGAEYRVLKGAENLLSEGRVKLLIEIAPWGDLERGTRPSDVTRLLANHGYNFRMVADHYLFYKARHPRLAAIKVRLLGLLLNTSGLKTIAKALYRIIRRSGIR